MLVRNHGWAIVSDRCPLKNADEQSGDDSKRGQKGRSDGNDQKNPFGKNLDPFVRKSCCGEKRTGNTG